MATETKPRIRPQRPKNDAYVGLLAISLLALITGCVLLYLDYAQYGVQKPPSMPAAPKATQGIPLPEATPPQPPEKTEGGTEAPKTETPTNPMPTTPPADTTPTDTSPPTGRPRAKLGSSGSGGGSRTPPTKPGEPSK